MMSSLHVEPEVFSAVTVFYGHRRTIVHNDGHAPSRQNSNLAHELAHGLLLHPPTPAMDDRGCRDWNQAVEDEASWLAGILLVSEAATIAIANGRWNKMEAAAHFEVSPAMIQYRLNATGAYERVRRAQRYRR
jgi:Zn-dependent peptidase ImmA (M78 family)